MRFSFVVQSLFANSLAVPAGIAQRLSSGSSYPLDFGRLLRMAGEQPSNGEGGGSPAVSLLEELSCRSSSVKTAAEGRVYEISLGALDVLADPAAALAQLEEAISRSADWGAEIVGLGSLAGIIGGQGTYLAERSPLPLTTGGHLTVYAAVENLRELCRQVDVTLARATVAVVGVPSAIATGIARQLAPEVSRLVLVGQRKTSRVESVRRELGAEFVTDVDSALAGAEIVVTASLSGTPLPQHLFRAGSLVVDVGEPGDVAGNQPQRDDVLILSGGLCQIPESMSRDSLSLGFFHGIVPGSLAETMILALESRAESFSLGRHLDTDRVADIGRLARRHGFSFSSLLTFGQRLDDARLAAFLKHATRLRGNAHQPGPWNDPPSTTARTSSADSRRDYEVATPAQLAPRAAARYARHINPVLTAISGNSGFTKVVVGGEGNYLWDEQGRRYLDFVAGFGSLNLGHNHPRVVAAVSEALRSRAPGFAQSAINPYAAALAERLVAVSPAGLEMVFFCNSGAEAVEAALKLARIATGREGLLHCERSFHGKTLGALSVTGNSAYQRPCEPLLPGVQSVPYGDSAALEEALASRRFAAFIVEPIQGEAGMIVPPAGYLRDVQTLCRRTDTLLVVDEVQTGLGRTGTMFAVEREGAEPDVLLVAKSLGGGLMPLGAMLCRGDLWRKAYGSVRSFALHTSTFGGGSLACAAGLETLRVLEEERLVENAAFQGARLKTRLTALWRELDDSIAEVRGEGLMIGLDLLPIRKSIASHWKRSDETGILQYLVPGLDGLLQNIQTVYLMQALLQTYGIYSQAARSNPDVLRIQPPLTIESGEIDRFAAAVDTLCREVRSMSDIMHGIISKSTLGQHAGGQTEGAAAASELP